jgi:hypothetical protein
LTQIFLKAQRKMGKPKTIDSLFKKTDANHSELNTPLNRPLVTDLDPPVTDEFKSSTLKSDATSLKRYQGLCLQI